MFWGRDDRNGGVDALARHYSVLFYPAEGPECSDADGVLPRLLVHLLLH